MGGREREILRDLFRFELSINQRTSLWVSICVWAVKDQEKYKGCLFVNKESLVNPYKKGFLFTPTCFKTKSSLHLGLFLVFLSTGV